MFLDVFSCTKYCLSLSMHSKLLSSPPGYVPIETKVIALNPDWMMQRVQHHHWHEELLSFTSFQHSCLLFHHVLVSSD